MFIKLETKIWSDYYFSFMKLIVTTFLVYKVKKCLLKSGKVSLLKSRKVRKSQGSSLSEHAQAVGHLCPKLGETMPKPWGDDAQAVGTQCPRLGQTLLIRISVD